MCSPIVDKEHSYATTRHGYDSAQRHTHYGHSDLLYLPCYLLDQSLQFEHR